MLRNWWVLLVLENLVNQLWRLMLDFHMVNVQLAFLPCGHFRKKVAILRLSSVRTWTPPLRCPYDIYTASAPRGRFIVCPGGGFNELRWTFTIWSQLVPFRMLFIFNRLTAILKCLSSIILQLDQQTLHQQLIRYGTCFVQLTTKFNENFLPSNRRCRKTLKIFNTTSLNNRNVITFFKIL